MLAEIDALDVPEQLVFNKVDAAAPETLIRLRALAPDAVFVSAHTGHGLDDAARGDRAAAAAPGHRDHRAGALHPRRAGGPRCTSAAEVLRTEHTPGGTLVHARVDAVLAEVLRPFAAAAVP